MENRKSLYNIPAILLFFCLVSAIAYYCGYRHYQALLIGTSYPIGCFYGLLIKHHKELTSKIKFYAVLFTAFLFIAVLIRFVWPVPVWLVVTNDIITTIVVFVFIKEMLQNAIKTTHSQARPV